MAVVDRAGNPVHVSDRQKKVLRLLYGNAAGRVVLRTLTKPSVSRAAGRFLDRRVSRVLIPRFVKRNAIDLSAYEQRRFDSFNDFFCRRILEGQRPIETADDALISPADSKLTVLPVTENATFRIKEVDYTFASLVKDGALASRFTGGMLMIFRLTVGDYHRYCYPVSGTESARKALPGVLHTVNPVAAEMRPIYAENAREYALIETEAFGTVLMMEVGALLVGRIVNDHPTGKVTRGAEKGHFEYGGSTVILALEKDRAVIDPELIAHSARGRETAVKMGERVGTAKK